MYSTCLFCKNSLGSNEAIEQFPVGRRLAFDQARGRLWVVCRKCERWNLTPLEQRWEAIEECERSFRDTKLRKSTDQIGLARLSEGLELVRIGKPLRPEFAAWRYGDQFGSRRRRHIIQSGAIVVGAAAIPFVGYAIGISLGAGAVSFYQAVQAMSSALYERKKVVAQIPTPDGSLLLVRMHEAKDAVMLPPVGDEPWGLSIGHRRQPDLTNFRPLSLEDTEKTAIRGDDALRVAAQILPTLNKSSAPSRVVQDAVELTARNTDAMESFSYAARLAARALNWEELDERAKLAKLPADLRLSLEMISHEDSERRALEGELYLLEQAWREAEEIAAISDNLFLPVEISTHLDELKRRRE